jgi:RES domain
VNPGPLSAPPENLASRRVDLVDFDEPLFRSHSIHRHPVFYGTRGIYRFDAPDGSYGVLYAAADAYCAFAESLIKNPASRVVTTSALKSSSLAELKAISPLRLIDLTPSGALVRIGADARLFSCDREVAQLWSKALHDHPVCANGILYRSRLDPARRAIALFSDRAIKLTELNRQAWYAPGRQRELLGRIAEHYKIELIEDRFVSSRKPVASVAKPGLLYEPGDL